MSDSDWLASLDVPDDAQDSIYDSYLDYCCMIAAGYSMPSLKWWWDEIGQECYEEDQGA